MSLIRLVFGCGLFRRSLFGGGGFLWSCSRSWPAFWFRRKTFNFRTPDQLSTCNFQILESAILNQLAYSLLGKPPDASCFRLRDPVAKILGIFVFYY